MNSDCTTQAIIHLASERGHTETDSFRSYNEFNFGSYQSEGRQPFGNLILVNDNTLAGGARLQFQTEDMVTVLVLPTVGAVEVYTNGSLLNVVEAGESYSFTAAADSLISYKNYFASELINFIQVWMLSSRAHEDEVKELWVRDDMNKLSRIHTSPILHLGKFMGRTKGEYSRSSSSNGIYVLVLEGVFEVAERLLEARDSLLLYHESDIDFEALSNEAILLVLECQV